jgi:hypothetical protein
MRGTTFSLLCVVSSAGAACREDGSATAESKGAESSRKLAGVEPTKFQCESIVTLAALGDVLGSKPKQIDAQMPPAPGTPRTCTYVIGADEQQWSFDIDCRATYKQTADKLFEQYREGASTMVAHYNAISDAGQIKPTDAGVAFRAPEGAVEVAVGAKGLDHHGNALIFVDDDAPCYVRVFGPDAAKRLDLGKLIAKNLTFANAPMTPRPFP